MILNAGILTTKLSESKAFYSEVLNFGVSFESEFYLLMHTPSKKEEISFLLPNHPTQDPFFHPPFTGQGVFLTLVYKKKNCNNIICLAIDKFSADLLPG